MDSDLQCIINVNTITHNATHNASHKTEPVCKLVRSDHIFNKSLNDLKGENIVNYFRYTPVLLFQHDLYAIIDLLLIRFLCLYSFHFNFS